MKLTKNDISVQVRQLSSAYRAVLIYGRDEGLVRERAEKIAHQIVDDLQDAFLVANIDPNRLKSEPFLLADEAAAISMMGGRRVIRVDGAGDMVTGAVKSYLDNPAGDGLIIMTGGSLRTSSSLVKLVTSAKNAAVIPCYEDDPGSLRDLVFEVMGEHNLKVEPAAVAYLQDALGGDRMVSRGELEKLALYIGRDQTVTLKDVRACIGDSGSLTLDMIANATTGGDLKLLDDSLFRAFNRGDNPIPILRNLARRLQKLHLVRGSIDQGIPAEKAVKTAVYSPYSPEKKVILAQLAKWSSAKLANALEVVMEAETECKVTGVPAQAICARACLRIANAARQRPGP